MNHSLNHAYRLVWNDAIGAYVAVAETARARGKRASGAVLAAAAGLTLALTAPAASALDASTLPKNGHIATGSATLTQSGNTLNVTQSSQKLVINWGSFDVGSSASVNFNQANSNAIALNRVGSGVASQIDGALTANGNVWILNSAGVTFGKTAQVNVGGLVASSLDLSDSNFLAGNYSFTNSGTAGAVSNAGSITAGSVVALVAPVVRNTGSIAAGSVALAAGDQVTLDFGGDGLLGYTIDKAALDALVENDGRLSGDTVSLSARSANAAVATVVNNEGVIEATGLSLNGGHIVLDGGDNGAVHVAGTLDTSSAQAKGGDITVTGHTLTLDSGATLNATGATGGGTIRVGGGLRGEDTSLVNAQNVSVSQDVNVYADATRSGDGGTVVFWADDHNSFAGNVYVRGGASSGNGGLAEVSGKETLHYSGYANALATHGSTGYLLLDPKTIDVYGGSDPGDGASSGWNNASDTTSAMKVYEKTLEAQDTNIALLASKAITFHDLTANGGDGIITLKNNVSFYAEVVEGNTSGAHEITFLNRNNTLEVFGTGYIFIEAGGSGTGTIGKSVSNGSNVGTNADTNLGTFNLVAHGTLAEGAVDLAPASMPAHVGTNYVLGQVLNQTSGSVLPGAGSITVLGADGLAVSGDLKTNGGYIHISGDADSGGVGNIVVSKTVSTNGGNFYMSFGAGASASATLTYGSVVDLSCNDSSSCTSSGHLYTGKDITTAGGASNQSMGASTGKVILGGTLIVGGNLDLTNYTINGGASIETDKDSTITLDTGTTLKPYVLDSTGVATTTTGPIGLQAGSIAINQSDSTLATSLGTVALQLKPADTGSNLFVNNTQGVMLGDGTVARDGTVSGQTTTSTFISASDLAYLEAKGVQGLIIGRTDSTGTVEAGNTNGTPNTFTFNTAGNLGLIGGNAVVNGTLTNNSGSVFVQAANTATVDQTHAGTDIGTGNLVITANGTIAAAQNIVAAAEGNFVNDSGSDALQAGGRWLVYSTDPSKDEGRNLDVDFKIYEATYGESDGSYTCTAGVCTGKDIAAYDDRGQKNISGVITNPVGTKADLVQVLNVDEAGHNGYLYKRTAFVDATLVGTVSKTYDGTTATSTTSTVATNPNNPATSGGTSLTADNIKLLSNGIDGDNVQLSIDAANIGAAQYDSKNVGSGKTVSATGVRLGVATNGGTTDTVLGDNTNPDSSKTVRVYGYRLNSDTVSGDIGSVTAKTISAGTVTADNKVYDGTTAATVSGGVLAGVVSGDSVSTSLTGQFDNKNAGTGKTVSVDLGLTGADAANYVLASSTASTTADITAKTVTAGAVNAANKVYDGTTAADVSGGALSGLIAGDTVSTTLAGQFDDKNAGTGKTVNVGLGLTGADAANYVLASSTASTTADITPKTVTASVTANGKVYDGTTAATLSGLSLDGVLAGDAGQVAVNEASASFADKNAGTGKTVTVNGLTLSGAEAGNYALATSSATAQADISAKTLSAGAVTAADKVYDGTTAASLSGGALSGLVAGDNVSTTLTGQFDDKNAGTGKTVNVDLGLTGADAANYVLASTSASTTADITPKTVSAGTVTVATKTYDGNTTANVSGGALSGLIAGDTVSTTLAGQFDDKNAGTGKTVNVGLGLTGADAANYVLASTTASTTADITVKTVTANATANSKVYDGTSAATLSRLSLDGVLAGDASQVAVNEVSASFSDKNAGTGKTVTVNGLTLSGAEAGNYVLATSSTTALADITAKTVTAGAVSAANKVYDGTTAADVSGGALSGLIAGDTVSTTLAGQFDDKNAGTGKTVNVGLGLTGADAANYVLASSTASTTADITPKTVTASVTANGKVYDGTTAATLSGLSLDGVLASDADQVAVNEASASFADKNAGTGKTVTVNGLTLSGAEAGNYALATSSATAQADISAKTLSAGAVTATDKVYDGTTAAGVSGGALSGLVAGDNVSTTLTGQFDDKNAGTGKTVNVDLGLTGTDAANYVLASTSASTTADITPKTVSAGTVTVATKTYDGNTTANVSGGALSGLVEGDTVGVALSGSYDSATAGTGKTVTVTLGLTGSDAANYQLDPTQTTVSGDITDATTAAVVGLQAKGNPSANSTGSASTSAALLPGAAGQATLYSLGTSSAVAGSSITQLSTDGEVRADGGVSIASEGTGVEEGIAEVNLPLFVAADASLDFKGWNHVIDQGSSLELKPQLSGDEVTEPRLNGDISARTEARLALSGGDNALMQLTLLADGTLLVEGDASLKALTPDTLSAYALSALKRGAHISVNKVKAVVLRIPSEGAKAPQSRG